MEFRVFASANTRSFFPQIFIHTLVCLFVKYRWDYVVLAVEGSKIILLLELEPNLTDLLWTYSILILKTEVKMMQVQIMNDNSANSPAFQDLTIQEEIRGRARFGLAHIDYMIIIGKYWLYDNHLAYIDYMIIIGIYWLYDNYQHILIIW